MYKAFEILTFPAQAVIFNVKIPAIARRLGAMVSIDLYTSCQTSFVQFNKLFIIVYLNLF